MNVFASALLLGLIATSYAEDKKGPQCKWLLAVDGQRNSGNELVTLKDISLEDCKKRLEDDPDTKYRSIEYHKTAKICYLQQKDRHSVRLTVNDANYIYLEYDCGGKFPDECQWERVPGSYISGTTYITLYTVTADVCKQSCEEETSFHCKGFDYYIPSKHCYLKMESRYGKSVTKSASYDFYERNCYDKFRGCNEANNGTWSSPVRGHYSSGSYPNSLTKVTVEECKTSCLQADDFHCMAINYDHVGQSCRLMVLNREIGDAVLYEHASYDYYELESCPESEPADQPEKNCKWMKPVLGYISGNDARTLTGITLDQCKKSCEREDTFQCNSFDYLGSSKNCYLQKVDRSSHTVTLHSSYIYYELDCSDDFPEECEWQAPQENKYISGNDIKTLTGMTPESCKKACEDETTFRCLSFDFLRTNNYCYLQRVNMYKVALSTHTSYDFYERTCQKAMKTCSPQNPVKWSKAIYNRYISGNDLKTLVSVTVDQCKEACVQATEFHCASIEYTRSNKYCYLQGVTSKEYTLLFSGNYEYYEIESCGGKKPETTKPKEDKCNIWLGPIKGHYMSGYDKKYVYNVADVLECKKACEEATDFDCLGFDHYVAAKQCYLQIGDRSINKLTAHSAYDYYERKCESDVFPDECKWSPVMDHRYLSGNDYKTVYNIDDPDECKTLCEEEETFDCLSFDFYPAGRQCYLSLKNMYGNVLTSSTSYQYYERNCKGQFRYCNHDSLDNAIWEGPIFGYYISGNLKSISNVEEEDCKRFCLEASMFHCLSFYYYPSSRTCYLTSNNREKTDLSPHSSYTYYELVSCPAPEGKENTAAAVDCKWLPAQTGKYIHGYDSKTLYNMDVTGCKKACEESIAFDCLSFDMYSTTCYLSYMDRRGASLSTHASYTYYERDCSANFPEQCEWQEVKHRSYISGNDAKTINTASPEACKKACEEEKDFHCVSFDYYRPAERCYLQRVDLYSKVKLSTHTDYDYYERNCYDKFRSCSSEAEALWEGPYSGHYYAGTTIVTLSGVTVAECKAACLQQDKFHCTGFNYYRSSTDSCYLLTGTDLELTSSGSYDFYKIVSCKETAEVPSDKPQKFKWVQKKGYYLSGNDKKTLYNYDAEECQDECENTKSFQCTSFDYLIANRYCYLQVANRFGNSLSAHASYDYYEMDFEDGFPEKCVWDGPYNSEYMGGSKRTLSGVTIEDCKLACEEEDTFNCLSFDFYNDQYCYLNILSKYEKKTSVHGSYTYFERNCKSNYRHCNEGAAVAWKPARHGKYLNGYDLKTLSSMEVDECKEACLQETSFHCRSFDYHRSSKYCLLQAYIVDELSVELTDSSVLDYYEIERCVATDESKDDADNVEAAEEEKGGNCVWKGPVNGYYLNGYDKKTVKDVTAGDCMKACEQEITFTCKSFDYYYAGRLCYLSDTDRSKVKLSTSASYMYYERSCEENFPKECAWVGPIENKYISGNDYQTLTKTTAEACKDACEAACEFRCMSFDYIPSSGTCYLSLASRLSHKLSTSASYSYYERNCDHEFDACNGDDLGDWWGPRYGKTLKGFATHMTINAQTADECKSACQATELFHCRSFIHRRSNGQCLLSAYSSESNELADSLDWNYYELNRCDGEEAPKLDLDEPKECVPDDFYVTTCACSGDPHCLSFDGKWLHFQGTCFLTAARDNCKKGVPTGPPTWEIISNPNAPTPTYPVSYVRSAQVNLHELGMTIGIYPGYATVNGVRVPGSPMTYADDKVKVQITNAVYVTLKDAFQVIFQDTYLQIKLVTSQREKVCGLCGNFNGDASDDWTIGNSKYCMSKYPNAVPGELTHDTNIMGTSWTNKIEDADAKCLNECPNPPHPSGCSNDDAFKAEDHCDVLQNMNGAFKSCLAKMSELQRKEVFDNCVYDSCNLNNYEDIVCRHSKSLARICTDQYNLKISWRSTNFCPMSCEENMEYRACGDPCLPSCSDPKGENCGDLGPCSEGCFCKSGYVFDGKKCIPQSSCGCKIESLGIFINVGESYTPEDCSTECTCDSAGADLTCKDMTCTDNFVCGAANGEPSCVCEPPYILNGNKCVPLPNPCKAEDGNEGEKKDILTCLTCDASNDEDCEENGTYEKCTGNDPICRVVRSILASGKLYKVERGCSQREECVAESIGEGVEYCEDGLLGKSQCTTCNFDLGDEDTDTPPAQCAEAIEPTKPPVEDTCTLPVDAGKGSAKTSRYYYDSKTKECIKFKFMGEGGNDNNFKTEDSCLEACGAPKPDFCSLPLAKGDETCDGKKAKTKKAFYFDNKKGKCKSFKYTGCGGNENNFKSKKECKAKCL